MFTCPIFHNYNKGMSRIYFVLSSKIALRSWPFAPRAYYVRHKPYAKRLSKEEADVLLMCDGEHDLEPNELLANLEERHLIEKCEKGTRCDEWSVLRKYSNRYFPRMNLMITGKCNYNCLHCFNAADNAPLMTEWNYEELLGLLDQAKDCGVNAFTITGGEPMLHPHFTDILQGIYERGMFVEELNTNGFFITQQILDKIKATGYKPLMKISFDGIGCHDWIRGFKGAEEKTLAAIELCIKNGFCVIAQTQVNKKNLHTLIPTAKMLSELGVTAMRLIKTTEVPRWKKNAPQSCLDTEEYYSAMLDFLREYKNIETNMHAVIWQFIKVFPKYKRYALEAVKTENGKYDPTAPICKGNRGMIGVTSCGDIVPCLQMSGYFEENDIHLGNLHKTPLSELLSKGDYIDQVCATLHQQRNADEKCSNCKYYRWCAGGCPALGGLYSPKRFDLLSRDITKCIFFENGWYHKVAETLDGWENKTPVDILEKKTGEIS